MRASYPWNVRGWRERGLVAVLFLVGCYPAAPVPDGAWVIDHALVWTGTGEVLEDRYVVILDDRVIHVALGEPPAGSFTIVDAGGGVVMPGLIDGSVRLADPGTPADLGDLSLMALGAHLAAGVTTVVDTGSPAWVRERQARVAAGEIVGPEIIAAGPVLGDTTAPSADDVPAPAPCQRLWRGDRCFDAPPLSDPLGGLGTHRVAALRAGAGADPGDLEAPAGTDYVAWIASSDDLAAALDADVTRFANPPYLDEMAAAAAADVDWVASSLAAHDLLARAGAGSPLFVDDPRVPAITRATWMVYADGEEDGGTLDAWRARAAMAADQRDIAAANLERLGPGPLIAGSAAGAPFVPHGLGLHHELSLLAGSVYADDLNHHAVLQQATVLSAQRLGREDLGTLRDGVTAGDGRRADLLILSPGCTPWTDLGCFGEAGAIRGVVLGGELLEGDALEALAAGEVSCDAVRGSGCPTPADSDVCFSNDDCPSDQKCDARIRECAGICQGALDTCAGGARGGPGGGGGGGGGGPDDDDAGGPDDDDGPGPDDDDGPGPDDDDGGPDGDGGYCRRADGHPAALEAAGDTDHWVCRQPDECLPGAATHPSCGPDGLFGCEIRGAAEVCVPAGMGAVGDGCVPGYPEAGCAPDLVCREATDGPFDHRCRAWCDDLDDCGPGESCAPIPGTAWQVCEPPP